MDIVSNEDLRGIELYASDNYYVLVRQYIALTCNRNTGKLSHTTS